MLVTDIGIYWSKVRTVDDQIVCDRLNALKANTIKLVTKIIATLYKFFNDYFYPF